MENHIKMDDLGVPLFLETPICLKRCSQNHPNNLSCQTIASSCFSRFPDGLGKKSVGLQAWVARFRGSSIDIQHCDTLQNFSAPRT